MRIAEAESCFCIFRSVARGKAAVVEGSERISAIQVTRK